MQVDGYTFDIASCTNGLLTLYRTDDNGHRYTVYMKSNNISYITKEIERNSSEFTYRLHLMTGEQLALTKEAAGKFMLTFKNNY